MINPTEPKALLPPIRSLFSTEYVEPAKWIEEIKKDGSHSALAAIENYEFIIACLIKAIFAMGITVVGMDKSLMDRVNSIFDSHGEYFRKYFNLKEEEEHYKQLYSIIRFIVFKDSFGNNKDDIKNFCAAWNDYFKFIFDSSEYYPEEDEEDENLSDQKFALLKKTYGSSGNIVENGEKC